MNQEIFAKRGPVHHKPKEDTKPKDSQSPQAEVVKQNSSQEKAKKSK